MERERDGHRRRETERWRKTERGGNKDRETGMKREREMERDRHGQGQRETKGRGRQKSPVYFSNNKAAPPGPISSHRLPLSVNHHRKFKSKATLHIIKQQFGKKKKLSSLAPASNI